MAEAGQSNSGSSPGFHIASKAVAACAQLIVTRLGLPYRKSLCWIGIALRMEMPEIIPALTGYATAILNHKHLGP
jgi:hypothetical protein